MSKIKKRKEVCCYFCSAVSSGDKVTRTGWLGQGSYPWVIQTSEAPCCLLGHITLSCSVTNSCFSQCMPLELCCSSGHHQEKKSSAMEGCRKPPWALVVQWVHAGTLQYIPDTSSGDVTAEPRLPKPCCWEGQEPGAALAALTSQERLNLRGSIRNKKVYTCQIITAFNVILATVCGLGNRGT